MRFRWPGCLVVVAADGRSVMPWGDWQFWVATLIALAAAGWLGRTLLRIARPKKGRVVKAELTVERERVD